MHRFFTFLILLSSALHAQAEKPAVFCQKVADDGKRLEQQSGPYRLTLTPTNDENSPCKAKLLGPHNRLMWKKGLGQVEFANDPIDVSNDGKPDFIVEDYSGGAHCCWTYWIISPQKTPVVVTVLENETGILFDEKWRGKHIISTGDGAFDYFVNSHAGSFFPDVYLLLKGRTLYDISGEREFRKAYDRTIAEARQELNKNDPQKKWLSKQVADIDEDIRYNIFRVVLSYLYSRRPTEAWRSLNELWPGYDRAQMKAGILKTRKDGILKQALPFSRK